MIQIRIRERCIKCEDGVVHDPHCATCGQRIPHDHSFWRQDAGKLPCGHPIRRLVEEYECPACQGTTWIERWRDFDDVLGQFVRANQLLQTDLALVRELNQAQAQEIEALRAPRHNKT